MNILSARMINVTNSLENINEKLREWTYKLEAEKDMVETIK